ncbi:hypothetical protein MesoLj131b_52770 [Mesorhizobium sp. 131-2-5]|nr:hypothetical protein MesoLj131b_52770 [Mesorhizobium sp. 131-2-5]
MQEAGKGKERTRYACESQPKNSPNRKLIDAGAPDFGKEDCDRQHQGRYTSKEGDEWKTGQTYQGDTESEPKRPTQTACLPIAKLSGENPGNKSARCQVRPVCPSDVEPAKCECNGAENRSHTISEHEKQQAIGTESRQQII